MFKKLFGDSEPKKAPPPPPKSANSEDNDIEFERQINNINITVEKMDIKIEMTQKKLENLDLEIRRLIAAKSKQKAKTKLTEAKQLRDLIEDLETKKTVFLDMKMKLDAAHNNQYSISLIRDANKLIVGKLMFLFYVHHKNINLHY